MLAWLATASSGVALTACGPRLCPNRLWPSDGRCYMEGTTTAQGQAPGGEGRAPWADVGRWAERIHRYQRPPRPGVRRPFGQEARPALAHYVIAMHRRLHPIFAGTYLQTIDGLPAGHPINQHAAPPDRFDPAAGAWDLPDDLGLWTVVEVILRGSDGTIVGLGTVRRSGVDEFDAAALEAVERASPYGPPPPSTLSADGNLYLEWRLFRSPLMGCETTGTIPYLFR